MPEDGFLELLREQPIYLFISAPGIRIQITYGERYEVIMGLVADEYITPEDAEWFMLAIEKHREITCGASLSNN